MRELRRKLSIRDLVDEDPLVGRLVYQMARGPEGVFLVGGYLRDYLLGRVSDDVDLVTTGDPSLLASRVASYLGEGHFLLDSEERVFRVVAREGKRRRTLDFSPLRGLSMEADLSMRDFTINALAVDLGRLAAEGVLELPRDLIDKHYGWRDLAVGVLRECHKESFLADPVRLVRAFRFRHLMGLEFEERTLNHLKKYSPLVSRVAGERVAAELMETLAAGGAARGFEEMESCGLLKYLFTELVDTVGLEQNAYHHLDVWNHTLATLEELDDLLEDPGKYYPEHAELVARRMGEPLQEGHPRRSFLRLAALYHDAGKPHTFSRGEDGRIHFHSHQKFSRLAILGLAERLRLSRRAREYLATVTGSHMDIGLALRSEWTSRARRRLVGRLGEDLVDVVLLSTADRFATRGPLTTREGLERYVRACRDLLDDLVMEKETPPLIRGRDLVRELGMEEGPAVGEVLRRVREAQMEGRIRGREEAIRLAEEIVSAGSASATWEGQEEGGEDGFPASGKKEVRGKDVRKD
ncbi:MAG: HD domain-containing protein [Actinomycetota bacterium]